MREDTQTGDKHMTQSGGGNEVTDYTTTPQPAQFNTPYPSLLATYHRP